MEEAKDTSHYKKLIENAEKNSDKLLDKIRPKIPEVAELVSDHILKIGK
ncbi:MAG: hypothetical protein ACTSQ2_11070 [Candidatus Heimdallarchaeaceae archaeon]